jgi:hypothetical protein
MGVAVCAYLLCPPEVRAAALTPVFAFACFASLIMGAVLWAALPRHLHPLVVVGLGGAIYMLIWAAAGRNLLKRETEGIA